MQRTASGSSCTRCSMCPSAVDRQSTLEIHSAIESQSHINFDHVLCIVVASGIAAVGLLSDSTAFILASFFISPLMSMVLAVAWGVTIKDYVLAARGLWNMMWCARTSALSPTPGRLHTPSAHTLSGAALAVASGMGAALFLSISPNQHEIEQPVYEVCGRAQHVS